MPEEPWKTFNLADELAAKRKANEAYREFLRVPSMSCGIYTVAAGSTDLQAPHDEDEIYFIIEGKGRLRVEDAEEVAGPGSILYVRATAEHSFFEVEEDLTVLVFFASGG